MISDYYVGKILINKQGAKQEILKTEKHPVKEGKSSTSRLFCTCRCQTHNYIYELTSKELDAGSTCKVCSKKYAVFGYNSLYDLRFDLVKYFRNPEETKRIKLNTNRYVELKCPICGHKKEMPVYNLTKNGFRCDKCSDGISYPNKFMRSLFDQIGINYEVEKYFPWAGRKSYDQYFPDYKLVVENHGKQHYSNDFLRDDISIDKEKQELAESNGLTYLAIDCSQSTVEYIKNSVMNSVLPEIFNFKENDIDWNECNKQGLSNKILQVCEDWNKTQDYDYMIQKYKLAVPTIRSYIQYGIEIGLCNTEYYCDASKRISECSQEAQARPIYSITDNIYFFSSHTAEAYYKEQDLVYQAGSILRAARQGKEYKGKRFEIITKQQFNEYYLDDNKITIGKLFNEKYFNCGQDKLKSA